MHSPARLTFQFRDDTISASVREHRTATSNAGRVSPHVESENSLATVHLSREANIAFPGDITSFVRRLSDMPIRHITDRPCATLDQGSPAPLRASREVSGRNKWGTIERRGDVGSSSLRSILSMRRDQPIADVRQHAPEPISEERRRCISLKVAAFYLI